MVGASGSIAELIRNLGFNGHPRAYYVLAWALHRLSDHPLALSIPNAASGVAATLLGFRWPRVLPRSVRPSGPALRSGRKSHDTLVIRAVGGQNGEEAWKGGRAENGGSVNWAFIPPMLCPGIGLGY